MQPKTNKQQLTGTVDRWIKARSFGFLTAKNEDGRNEMFYFHISDLEVGSDSPFYGAVVHFDADPEREGRLRSAANVVVETQAVQS